MWHVSVQVPARIDYNSPWPAAQANIFVMTGFTSNYIYLDGFWNDFHCVYIHHACMKLDAYYILIAMLPSCH